MRSSPFGHLCTSRPSYGALKMVMTHLGSLVALASLVIGCGAPTTPPSAPHKVSTVAKVQAAWQQDVISVCWEIVSRETESYRKAVQEAITEHLADFRIRFSGFELCTPQGGDIRIFIYDDGAAKSSERYRSLIRTLETENFGATGRRGDDRVLPGLGHPRVRAFGRFLKGKEAGLILNQTFENAQPGFAELYASFTPLGQHNLSVSVAMHEFGHALGLRHEDAHSDRTCDDYAEDKGRGPGAAVDITPYNPFSFMSRCYYRTFNYNRGMLMPNARDIEGLNVLHGQPTR